MTPMVVSEITNFQQLVDEVVKTKMPKKIETENGNAFLVAEDVYELFTMSDEEYIESVPGLADRLRAAKNAKPQDFKEFKGLDEL